MPRDAEVQESWAARFRRSKRREITVQWNWGMVALVLVIAVSFVITGPWWAVPLVLAFFPLAWLRARLVGNFLTNTYLLDYLEEIERLRRQLDDVRLSMETLRREHVNAWNEADRLYKLIQDAPHEQGCATSYSDFPDICNCWKAVAR